MDFCGSWHFLGPVSWHIQSARGDISKTRHCITQGIIEYENLAQMSGHPAFVVGPLYDGYEFFSYPRNKEPQQWQSKLEYRQKYVKEYIKLMAFEMPKNHKIVFARSIDVADYYLRISTRLPYRLCLQNDHPWYDTWWQPA